MKKVINTYIVTYKESFANNSLAILFELKDGTFIIKYDGFNNECMDSIDREEALKLIK